LGVHLDNLKEITQMSEKLSIVKEEEDDYYPKESLLIDDNIE
jgi:hypothetical protein